MPADPPDAASPEANSGPGEGAPTPEAIEAGRHLFAQDCGFLGAAAGTERLLETGLPEVAFAGRSNVGKSSLVNALTGRRTLARISHTPGRTHADDAERGVDLTRCEKVGDNIRGGGRVIRQTAILRRPLPGRRR